MKRLTDCPHSSIREQRRWCASVVDDGTRMSLDVIADVPCVAFTLDGKQWGTPTSRPDGVVVFEHDPAGGIVFVELKGKVDPEDPHKPFDQIRAGVAHFSNTETHGREHHASGPTGMISREPPPGASKRRSPWVANTSRSVP